MSRPAVSEERLSRTAKGKVRYRLKGPRPDGTTDLAFEPLGYIGRLGSGRAAGTEHRGGFAGRDNDVHHLPGDEQVHVGGAQPRFLQWSARARSSRHSATQPNTRGWRRRRSVTVISSPVWRWIFQAA